MTSLEQQTWTILDELGYVVKSHKQRSLIDAANTIYAEYPISRVNDHTFYADFALPYAKIDIEIDGEYWHDKLRDCLRDQELRSLGWRVLRIPEYYKPELVESWLTRGIWNLLEL